MISPESDQNTSAEFDRDRKLRVLVELCQATAGSGLYVGLILRRRFPGTAIWFGPYTGSWWAMLRSPAGWRLVEALDPEELTRAINNSGSWPWPVGTRRASPGPCRRY
jgi:hypothetical protein